MLATAGAGDSGPCTSFPPDNHLRRLQLGLASRTKLALRTCSPGIEGAILRNGHVVVDACTDVYNGIVVVGEGYKGWYCHHVLLIGITVFEGGMVVREADLSAVRSSAGVYLA